MKLLRLGNVGQEIPAAIDKNGKYRNLSSHINDFTPETINFENLEKLKKVDLESLEEIDQNNRIGSCITKPSNFFAIGLNYIPPPEPVLSITGAFIPSDAIFSATKVAKGYTVEDPTIEI